MQSKSLPGKCLLSPDGRPVHRYEFYVRLRLREPWRVPMIFGRLPRVPDDTSTVEEQGLYGLCMLLLFRPHRFLSDFVRDLHLTCGGPKDAQDAWAGIRNQWCRWRRDDVDAIALLIFD